MQLAKIILVQRFCPLKVKISQFPDGFLLRTCTSVPLLPLALQFKNCMSFLN